MADKKQIIIIIIQCIIILLYYYSMYLLLNCIISRVLVGRRHTAKMPDLYVV